MENNFSGTKLINKNVFLSSADHYVQFGIGLGKLLDVYIDKNDYDETVHFFDISIRTRSADGVYRG